MKSFVCCAITLLFFLFTLVFADDTRWENEKVRDYLARKHRELNAAAVVGQADKATDPSSSNTGLPSFGHRLNSSLDDFAPLFQGFVSSKTIAEDGKSLAIQFSSLSVLGVPLKLSGVIYEPEPNAALIKTVPENVRDAVTTALNEGFNDFEDWGLSFAWQLNNRRFGRRIRTDQLDALMNEVFDGVVAGAVDFDILLNQLLDAHRADLDKTFNQIPEPKRTELKTQIDQALSGQRDMTKKINSLFGLENMAALKTLFENQPQLNFSGTLRKRNSYIGADQWQVTGSYEMSLGANWNKFIREACGGNHDCNPSWKQWLAYRGKVNDSVYNNQRLVIAADWTRIKAYDVTLADVGGLTEPVSYQEAEDDRLTLSLVFGRNLAVREGRAVSRLDISASYEDFSVDETKNDRGVVTVTYTHEINPTLYLPISVEYANHPVYKTEPDVDLGLHFGLSYKLDRR